MSPISQTPILILTAKQYRMCIVIYSILRISQLDCLPKEWCIFTSEKLLYTVATAFLKLSLCILFLIHCRSSITEQVKCHTYHFQTATCLPALLQTFQSYVTYRSLYENGSSSSIPSGTFINPSPAGPSSFMPYPWLFLLSANSCSSTTTSVV